VFFIDPPYTAGGKSAGSRLYTHYNLNHNHLFDLASNLKGEFLMTYDNADEVYKLAESHSLNTRLIPMNNTHHAEMKELIINRDLSWLD
jgi:DNA adenine methylase